MKKIKVLFEGISQNPGGIENFVYNIYKNMDKDLYDVSFLVDDNVKIAHYDDYEKDGCKFFYTENRKKSYFKYLKDLKEIYTQNQFDIIHINVMSYSLFERITYACKYSDAKVIVHSHSTGYAKGYYKTKLLHKIGKIFVRSKKFYRIACGESAGKFMFGKSNYTVINNGIDMDKFKYSEQARNEVRHEFKIDRDTTVISHVGVFYPVKNHNFLIDIFNEYLKVNSNSHLVLVGDGFLKSKIEQKVDDLNIKDKVILTGKRNDVNKIYSASDVYVMPSISEGLSISLCEAQVNGLKCYTTDGVDRNSDISGNVEFLSLKKEAKYWAKEISKNTLRDFDVVNKIKSEYDLKNTCKAIYEYYSKLLNKSS